MRRYKVRIGFMVEQEITAKNKKEAEEIAWFYYDQNPTEPTAEVKEIEKSRV